MPLRIHFTRDQIQAAVTQSRSYVGAARYLGYHSRSAGVMVKRWVEEYGISTDHFGGRGSHSGRSSNFEVRRAELAEAVLNSRTFSDVCRYLGRSTTGGTHTRIRQAIQRHGLDTSHFLTRSEASSTCYRDGYHKRTAERLFVLLPPGSNRTPGDVLRRLLIESGVKEECAQCGLGPWWNELPLTLQVDHINGCHLDNLRENLRLLCPNCHSQQPTSLTKGLRYQPLCNVQA